MPTLYVMVGIPASGKSTWASHQKTATEVSSDAIREEFFGSAKVQKSPKMVFAEFHQRIRLALAAGRGVIADATHVSLNSRLETLRNPPTGTTKVAVLADVPLEKALQNNLKRERHVPEHVIRRMANRLHFEPLSSDEGFDEIICLKF